MPYFIRNGNAFNITASKNMDLHDQLPAGNYIIKQDMFKNFFFEQVESFEQPVKLYGNTTRHTDRIINTFLSRPATTGILLSGEKGSGKTLLARNLSLACAARDIPCIIINSPWAGDSFNQLMQQIEQPCMVLFDEFEKVYDKESQEAILTLLDGVFPSKKLFVLTCNDKWRVDSHMRNRPGRIFYNIEFSGLDYEFIEQYCQDNLEQKQHIDGICKISSMFSEFNFDMLKALVEEMNRYHETPQEAMKMLNAKPEYSEASNYTVTLRKHGQVIPKEAVDDEEWQGNPLMRDVVVDYDLKYQDSEEYDPQREVFAPRNLKHIDAKNGRFVFVNDGGAELVLERVKPKVYSYPQF